MYCVDCDKYHTDPAEIRGNRYRFYSLCPYCDHEIEIDHDVFTTEPPRPKRPSKNFLEINRAHEAITAEVVELMLKKGIKLYIW